MLATAVSAAAHQYRMDGYYCTTFALDIFNSHEYVLYIPNATTIAREYGKTPNGLYKKIKDMRNNNYLGAHVAPGIGTQSTPCNN